MKILVVYILSIIGSVLLADSNVTPLKDFWVKDKGDDLEIHTPYGVKYFVGDLGLKDAQNYRIDIPLDQLIPPKVREALEKQEQKQEEVKKEVAREVANDGTDSMVIQANRLYNNGEYLRATMHVEEILRRNPEYVRGWIMKGSLLWVQGEKDLALKAWKEAEGLEPNNDQIKRILSKYK